MHDSTANDTYSMHDSTANDTYLMHDSTANNAYLMHDSTANDTYLMHDSTANDTYLPCSLRFMRRVKKRKEEVIAPAVEACIKYVSLAVEVEVVQHGERTAHGWEGCIWPWERHRADYTAELVQ